MATLDRPGTRMQVSLPITQTPARVLQDGRSHLLRALAFMLSLWLVTALFFGAAMSGFSL